MSPSSRRSIGNVDNAAPGVVVDDLEIPHDAMGMVQDIEGIETIAQPDDVQADVFDDDQEPYDVALGDPFALAVGCALLAVGPGVPGCIASVRCDCGRAFKLDLLSAGRKPCPGCRVEYSHTLLVAPADDTEIAAAFLDTIEGIGAADQDGA